MIELDEEKERQEFFMYREEDRLKTFVDWPFREDCKCTPEKMAAAGFYHTPTDQEPDLAKCFMCSKELDGWEPDDNPWAEHESHSGSCVFLKMAALSEITVQEFLELEKQRQTNRINKYAKAKAEEFKKYSEQTRAQMELLA